MDWKVLGFYLLLKGLAPIMSAAPGRLILVFSQATLSQHRFAMQTKLLNKWQVRGD